MSDGAAAHHPPEAPDAVITHTLRIAREQTGMQLVYLAEFRAGRQVLRQVDGDGRPFGFHVGHQTPLEASFCQRVVDGRLPRVVRDAASHPITRDLPGATRAGVRGYLAAPVRLPPDERLYGTLCCVDARPRPELDEPDEDLLEHLARLVGAHMAALEGADRRVRGRDALLAAVAHDLRTPLAAIANLAEDLQLGEVPVDEATRTLRAEAMRCRALVGGLQRGAVERARQRPPELQTVDLRDLLDQAAREAMIAHGVTLRLELELPGRPVQAPVDPDAVLRALSNLLDNAARHAPDAPVRLSICEDGSTALITVADRGPGIPPADLPRVHEAFYRSSASAGVEGTGLGLATVQAVADRHEGTLEVSSQPGEGTEVRLRMPLRPLERQGSAHTLLE